MTKKAGRPRRYTEGKKQTGIWLTDDALTPIDEAATALGISRSELIERLGRKGVDWLKEQNTETDIPQHARHRILKEYGEKLQRVIALDEDSVFIAIHVCPPYVYLDFNKEGRSAISLETPVTVNEEKMLRLTKTTDIWDYSNITAYLDGCNVFAELIQSGWDSR